MLRVRSLVRIMRAIKSPRGRVGYYAPWHFLYFFPLPQLQGSFRPSDASKRIGSGFPSAAFCSDRSAACGEEAATSLQDPLCEDCE